MSSYVTPPQYAERIGVHPAKVLTWIRRGELVAVDAATRRGGRPRWRISPAAIEKFEQARMVRPAALVVHRRRVKSMSGDRY